jgi:hypothetical protein
LALTTRSGDTYIGGETTITGNITLGSTSIRITFGPACTITGTVTASSADCYIKAEAKCNFDGIVTLSGAGCSLICENGCDLDGVVMSGSTTYFNGGGWDTLVDGTTANDAFSLTSTKITVENCQVTTTAGGGTGSDCFYIGNTEAQIRNVLFKESDSACINMSASADRCMVTACTQDGNTVDSHFANQSGSEFRMTNNIIGAALGNTGIGTGTAPNCLYHSNIFQDSGVAMSIDTTAENNSLAPNVINGTVTDNSGTSTADGTNEIY